MKEQSIAASLARGVVRRFDGFLRRRLGVFHYSEDPGCRLRLSLPRTPYAVHLADGTDVAAGDTVANVHLWNERMPPIPAEGADLRWAREWQRGMTYSLRLLAAYLDADPRYAAIPAVYGQIGFATTRDADTGSHLLRALGFEMFRPRAKGGLWWRFSEFWQNVYSYALLWTYNPNSLRDKPFSAIERLDLFMSRNKLRERYGEKCDA